MKEFESVKAAIANLDMGSIRTAIAKVGNLPTPRPASMQQPARTPSAPAHMRAHARIATSIRSQNTAEVNSNGDLGAGETKILIAAAQYSDVGVDHAQVAVLTGYKETSRRTYLQRLSQRGYIEQRGNRIFATAEGVAALGDNFEPLPQGDELRQYWLQRLSGGEREILNVLIAAYPDAVAYGDLEAATGYKETSRRTYLQRLGARRLVTSEAGAARASEELFG
jgi:hypothetical protein